MLRTIKIEEDSQSNSDYLFALFKGDSGSGKTIAAASCPKVLLMDFDQRTAPIRTFFPDKKDIEIIRFANHIQVLSALDELMFSCPYETIVWDSLTLSAAMCMMRISSVKGQVKGDSRNIAGIAVNSIEDYNAESSFLMQAVDKLKSFQGKKHVIMTAHVIQTETKDLKTNRSVITRTLLTAGKRIAKIIPCAFDETYHFQVEPAMNPSDPNQYVAYTSSTGDDWAKTAINLPSKLDFTNRSFYEVWMEAKGAAKLVPDQQLITT